MSNLVPYLGGKNRLAKTVIAKLPAHTCYCEVFAGGTTQLLLRDLPVPVVKAFKLRALDEDVTVRELFLAAVEAYLKS